MKDLKNYKNYEDKTIYMEPLTRRIEDILFRTSYNKVNVQGNTKIEAATLLRSSFSIFKFLIKR